MSQIKYLLLMSRPARVTWSPDGPVSHSAVRMCVAVDEREVEARRAQMILAGYTVRVVEAAPVEMVSM